MDTKRQRGEGNPAPFLVREEIMIARKCVNSSIEYSSPDQERAENGAISHNFRCMHRGNARSVTCTYNEAVKWPASLGVRADAVTPMLLGAWLIHRILE